MKKREEFAITLRKKKHDEMIQTKRRNNIQRAFERTTHSVTTLESESQLPIIEIKDVPMLDHYINMIDQIPPGAEERLMILRGIRVLTTTT